MVIVGLKTSDDDEDRVIRMFKVIQLVSDGKPEEPFFGACEAEQGWSRHGLHLFSDAIEYVGHVMECLESYVDWTPVNVRDGFQTTRLLEKLNSVLEDQNDTEEEDQNDV